MARDRFRVFRGLTWKIGLLLALAVAGAVAALVSFAQFRSSVAELAPTMNVAGRQRMLAVELLGWARMVAMGHEGDREGLEERIASFDAAQTALRRGGLYERHAVAPTSPELEPALARLDRVWEQDWRPRLVSIARGRPGEAQTTAAVAWLTLAGDGLSREADAYVDAIELSATVAMQREARNLVAIACLDLVLLLVAVWLTRRQIVRPLRALTDAAKRAQRGDFSAALPVESADELGVLAVAFNEAATEVGRLLAAEARYHDVIEHLSDAVVMASSAGAITYANAAAERMVGRSRDELIGSSLALLIPEKYRAAHDLAFARVVDEKGSVSGRILQAEALRADGSVVPVDISVSAHQVGENLLFTGVLRDVSERVQLTARVMQMDRMIAVGTLAAGVAHEINNPLAYVMANLDYLADEIPRLEGACSGSGARGASAAPVDSSFAELLDVIREAQQGAERMRNIVRDLKSFSQSADAHRSRVDVGRILESSINVAWNEIRHRARLTKDLAEVPPVDANESRLGQVCLNLLVNAAQAIPEGAADANEIHVSTRREGGLVVLTIRDTGSGIPTENLPRIFDPFFTTKPVGQGMGLGLSICQRILHDMGGTIAVESVVGSGTTVRVTLPVAREAVEAAAQAGAPRAQLVARRGRILFVDDERSIGAAMRRALASEHDVTCVQSGVAALELLRDGAVFDVIISDVMMPEMDGMELHEELARAQPGQEREMIFMTGGAFTPKAREFLQRIPNLQLEKPFNAKALRALLRERVR